MMSSRAETPWATLRTLQIVAFAAVLVACDPAPDCDQTIAALASYAVADQTWADKSFEKLVPYSNRLTGSDTEFLRNACRDDHWSAAYRRCLGAARSTTDVVGCNVDDKEHPGLVWAALPHERAWIDALADKAATVMTRAADLARDQEDAVEAIEHDLAELDQAIERAHGDAGKLAEIERARGELRTRIAAAREAARRAAALAKECEVRPLEKPACLAAGALPAAAK